MRRICLYGGFAVLAVAAAGWAAAAARPQAPDYRDLVRVSLREPRLRINAGGHTGAVRALAFTPDSVRLCSAAADKETHVWNLAATGRDLRRVLLRERTIRWQVARGPRGVIFALAAAPSDGLLAIAGYGAAGSLGEILLVDPVDGTLVATLKRHRQTVSSLAFSADGLWLASMDLSGVATLWKRLGRDRWQPRTLCKADRESYGEDWARETEKMRPLLRPITIAGNRAVFLPILKGRRGDGGLTWRLRQISLANPAEVEDHQTIHQEVVTALAASRDGSRLASADLQGNLFVWDLALGARVARLEPEAVVFSLCFDPTDRQTLVAGTQIVAGEAKSQLQLWNLDGNTMTVRRSLPDHVLTCAVSPDGKRLAYSGGVNHEVFVEPLNGSRPPTALQGSGRRVFKVAFAKEEPIYRVAFGTEYRSDGFNTYGDLQQSFDTVALALGSGETLKPSDWITVDEFRGDWRARPTDDGGLELLQGGRPQGRIALDPRLEGRPRCYCWIPDRQGRPVAVAVGTDVQNSIYVYSLRPPFPILRHFRGHHDYVTSLGVSRFLPELDTRHLVSASADGTVRIWSLSGYQQGRADKGRWGANFSVADQQLVATTVDPAGPLYGKGMRAGDVLRQIRWLEGARVRTLQDPEAILRQLQQCPWSAQIVFDTTRKAARREPFQRVPAWEPMATLFVTASRQWAFWTPSGYYDASHNGHRLFGWQVNRGLDRLPDFYRADQFYKKLERPDVLEQLLPAGSLQVAYAQASAQARRPAEPLQGDILQQQIAATPRVTIESPRAGVLVNDPSTKVRAKITVPTGRKLLSAKVVANGVVAAQSTLVAQQEVADGEEFVYEWDVPLPNDTTHLIRVGAETDAPTAAFGDVVIQHSGHDVARRRLFLLAMGVNEYADPEIPALRFAVDDATEVVGQMRSGSKSLYTLDEATLTLLTDENVTPKTWKDSVEKIIAELKDRARPDDLLVLFLAGHGVVHPQDQTYYFVGHQTNLDDFYEKHAVEDCISWSDFRLLADVPCRKLALLDTCHAGAIQPLRSRDLKAGVRQLQQDVFFTVTASTGQQKSAEKPDWGHGAFTKCLLEALQGRADRSGEGTVTLNELVSYVEESVPKLTAGVQTPTAAPDEILPLISLPLTRAE